jgi:hypothetical protein
MQCLIRFGLTLSIVLTLFLATANATRCTSEQREKMIGGGLSPQEITSLCDLPTLSLQEADELFRAYVGKNRNHEAWYRIALPRPGNIKLHDLNKYYQALKEQGYVTQWQEDRAAPGEIKVSLTRKGKQFIETGKPPDRNGKYSILCCDLETVEVMCLTVNPAGDSAEGIFQAHPSQVFTTLQWVAKRDVTNVDGLQGLRSLSKPLQS